MEHFIREIEKALAAELWTIALQSSLALVDICAATGSEDGESNGRRFREWFEAGLSPAYPELAPEDAWRLRCRLLHQGHLRARNYSAIIFTLPNTSGNYHHRNTINDALNLDLVTFCRDIVSAVRAWWSLMEHRSPVQENAEHVLRFRPEGLAPYMVGMPVLA